MKNLTIILLAVAVLFVPAFEMQAKTCFADRCNYVENGGFGSYGLYWTEGSAANPPQITYPYETTCYASNRVVELDNTESVSQSFYVDGTYSSFKINLRAFLIGDTNNFYDELRITVTNNDTGASEFFTLNGSSYDTQCAYNVFNLVNDYSNHNVTIKVASGNYSLHKWQVDDVAFWAVY